MLVLGRFARRVLLAELAQGMLLGLAGGAVLGLVIGLLGTLLGWPLGFDAGWAEAMFGAVIGVIVAWSHRSRLEQIAARLDASFTLGDRLVTAAECIVADRHEPSATCVVAQAARAIKSLPARPPTGVEFRRPMLAAFAALLLLAGAQYGSAELARPGQADRIVRAVAELTPSQRVALAEALRRKAAEMPAESARLDRTARAIQAGDDAQLRELLEEFARRGVALRTILPENISRRAELPDEPTSTPSATQPGPEEPTDEPSPAGVSLPGPADGSDQSPASPASRPTAGPGDWDELRSRAASHEPPPLPAEHRQTIERYYSE